MNSYCVVDSKFFVVAGISHQRTGIENREQFALTEDEIKQLISEFKQKGGEGIFATSTCNRTEIYALCNEEQEVLDLFRSYVKANDETFAKHVYCLNNQEAIQHLFRVGVGLESAIPGDFQIIGQLKSAFKLSKSLNATNSFLERLINTITKCSKAVKNNTNFSSGATSTSYAAVEYIKSVDPNYQDKTYLLYGSGKIGRHVCENLVKNVNPSNITLVNRTAAHAKELADKFGLIQGDYKNLKQHLSDADVVLVSTAANDYTVKASMLDACSKLLIDLSMPRNIDPKVEELEHIELISLDELSLITAKTLEGRTQEKSVVNGIIDEFMMEFMEWLEQRRLVPTITAIRERLHTIKDNELSRIRKEKINFDQSQLDLLSSDIIQKFTNQLSNQLKSIPSENLEVIHQLFQVDVQEKK